MFDASPRVWQALLQVPSERTMSGGTAKSRRFNKGENAMDLGLQDKHAIVTGGSRGIGRNLELA